MDVARILAFQYPVGVPLVDYRVREDVVTGPFIEFWSGSLGTQPTPAELATIEASAAYQTYITPAAVQQRQREKAADAVVTEKPLVWIRAAAAVLCDEINLLRQRDRDRSDDVAAATSLADLKTRWAARSALTDRTLAQAKTAIQNKISTGVAD